MQPLAEKAPGSLNARLNAYGSQPAGMFRNSSAHVSPFNELSMCQEMLTHENLKNEETGTFRKPVVLHSAGSEKGVRTQGRDAEP